jgi:hypothetical protein
MDAEMALVQAELNGFAAALSGAGVDLRLVLVNDGICVPAPLGSGACPGDQNLPIYRHTIHYVGSTHVFSSILNTYSSWSAWLRPGASKTLVAVTDDDDSLGTSQFASQLALAAPGLEGYRFHSIVALSNCPFSSAVGTQYVQLSQQTGGQTFDLCDQDFGPDFDAIASDILSTPSSYCTSSTSTHGCNASISASGTPSASAGSGFTITVGDVEGQRPGLIFYGVGNAGWTPTPWSGASTSYLCVEAPRQRLTTLSSGGTAGQCDGLLAIDWNGFVSTHLGALGAPFSGGELVQAQGWFRDPPAPKQTNLSDALAFFVQP